MTTAFLVIQNGVYRHGIGGIFSTVEAAKAAADACAGLDHDAYHNYEVIPFQLDGLAVSPSKAHSSDSLPGLDFNEPRPVYSVSKPREMSRMPRSAA
jgi:hypothetical protein